jgi:hypothetical protein
MPDRTMFLRGGKSIDQRLTATALDRVADWLDIADSQTKTAVYPEIPESKDHEELCYAWMWAAITIANLCDLPSDITHQMATSIRLMYADDSA